MSGIGRRGVGTHVYLTSGSAVIANIISHSLDEVGFAWELQHGGGEKGISVVGFKMCFSPDAMSPLASTVECTFTQRELEQRRVYAFIDDNGRLYRCCG